MRPPYTYRILERRGRVLIMQRTNRLADIRHARIVEVAGIKGRLLRLQQIPRPEFKLDGQTLVELRWLIEVPADTQVTVFGRRELEQQCRPAA